jgi:hypothetical protein
LIRRTQGAAVTRKAISVLIAAVLAFSLFPAVAAFASAPGSARLTQGGNVLPGTAAYAIEVNSTAFAINTVRIDLPFGEAGVRNSADAITPPAGWTATKRSTTTGAESIFFRGGSIPAGGKASFAFPATVDRPLDRDVAGTFIVALSGDNGATSQNATLPVSGGSLRTTVKVLSVEAIAPTAPAGVTDGTGTNGQDITYATSIRNHAQLPLVVTPSLTIRQGSSSTNDSVGTATPASTSIPAGGTSNFSFPVKLGTGTSNRDLTFTGGGSATDGAAQAISKSGGFVSQTAPTVDLSGLAPKLVRPNSNVTFSLDAAKKGTPALNIASGSLSFAETTAAMQATNFGEGAQSGKLSFSGTVKGADKDYPVSVTLAGTDANGASFSQTKTLTDTITIDGLAPVVTLDASLPLDGDGRQQESAKTGDTISVSGTIDDNSAKLDFVELRPNVGPAITVPVTLARGRFTGSVKAPFELAANSFTATGQATDVAGNSGAGASSVYTIDNVAPRLVGPAVTVEQTDLPSLGNSSDVPAIIQVQFTDNGDLKGGCDAKQYSVAGNAVSKVTYSDGSTCVPGAAGPSSEPDNFRLLFLTKPIRRDETPSVTYTPLAGDRAKDGAGNFAANKVIDTVSGIAPIIPELVDVFRNTATATADSKCDPAAGRCEKAYYDSSDKTYYTRFGGTDTIARFSGARAGYTVEVLDANDTVLLAAPVSTFTSDIRIPLGATDGSYVRKLRLVNSAGIKGGTLAFNIGLDQVAPVISSVGTATTSAAAGTTATANFSEKIVAGTDFSFDWNVVELLANGNRRYYSPDKVSGSGASRTATFTPQDVTRFETLKYDFQEDGGGKRYADRAGNLMLDNL